MNEGGCHLSTISLRRRLPEVLAKDAGGGGGIARGEDRRPSENEPKLDGAAVDDAGRGYRMGEGVGELANAFGTAGNGDWGCFGISTHSLGNLAKITYVVGCGVHRLRGCCTGSRMCW